MNNNVSASVYEDCLTPACFDNPVAVRSVQISITVHVCRMQLRCVRSANLELQLPSVIALKGYVNQHSKTPAFTRRNLYLRDGYQCGYCQVQPDHAPMCAYLRTSGTEFSNQVCTGWSHRDRTDLTCCLHRSCSHCVCFCILLVDDCIPLPLMQKHFQANDLSFDHVLPRKHGGTTSWRNVITSCNKCNNQKGDCHPNQLSSIG